MSATDKLRRMLDERGVDYRTDDGKTVWATHWEFGKHSSAMFSEYDDGECVFVTSGHTWTPEQAIAVTLGNPIDADLCKALNFMRIWISEDAHLGESAISYELEKAEGLRKLDAIEDAIAATLGKRRAD